MPRSDGWRFGFGVVLMTRVVCRSAIDEIIRIIYNKLSGVSRMHFLFEYVCVSMAAVTVCHTNAMYERSLFVCMKI